MSPKLLEAVAELGLRVGEEVSFKVDGQTFRIQAVPEASTLIGKLPPIDPIPPEYLENVMMLPPYDLPIPTTGIPIPVRRGSLPQLDIPVIPDDFGEAE